MRPTKKNSLRIVVTMQGEPVVFDVPVSRPPTIEDVRRAAYRFAAALEVSPNGNGQHAAAT